MDYKEVKPISRQERILDGEDIKPISRLEYFLKKAAQSGGVVLVDELPEKPEAGVIYALPNGEVYTSKVVVKNQTYVRFTYDADSKAFKLNFVYYTSDGDLSTREITFDEERYNKKLNYFKSGHRTTSKGGYVNPTDLPPLVPNLKCFRPYNATVANDTTNKTLRSVLGNFTVEAKNITDSSGETYPDFKYTFKFPREALTSWEALVEYMTTTGPGSYDDIFNITPVAQTLEIEWVRLDGINYYQVEFHDDKFYHEGQELTYNDLKNVMDDQSKFLWLSLNNLVYIPNITVDGEGGALAFGTTFTRNDGTSSEPDYETYASRVIINSNNEIGFEEYKLLKEDDGHAGTIIVNVGSAQESFDSKVFPKISIENAKKIYNSYILGNNVIIRWMVMNAIPVEATVIGSDYVNGTKSFNVIIHDTYAIDYSFTDSATTGYATFTAANLAGGGVELYEHTIQFQRWVINPTYQINYYGYLTLYSSKADAYTYDTLKTYLLNKSVEMTGATYTGTPSRGIITAIEGTSSVLRFKVIGITSGDGGSTFDVDISSGNFLGDTVTKL